MITKFKRPDEPNSNNILVTATIEAYRLTTRFGRLQPNIGAINPYDIELIGTEAGEKRRFAVINFWDTEPLRNVEFNPTEAHYELFMPSGSYTAVVDLLRNEKLIAVEIKQNEENALMQGFMRTTLT